MSKGSLHFIPSTSSGNSIRGHKSSNSKEIVDLTWEDEEAILGALTDDDDFGFAAALQNSMMDPFSAATGPFSDLPVTTTSNVKNLNRDTSSASRPIASRSDASDKKKIKPGNMSLVDPEWETIDPTPDIWSLFNQFNKEFFWGMLTSVEVKWSKQMTSCAGICSYQARAGYCSIGLSFPLLRLRPRKDLIQTLLHEMIHAYLFVSKNDRDRDSHGPFFHEHMFRINKQAGTSISVYHSFHDEVAHYQQHIWRCDGPCRDRKPYNGFVKRARNRAPSKNDFWWNDHQAKCGGNFVKIHEPEGFGVKKKKGKAPKENPPTLLPANQKTLNDFKGFKSPTKPKEKPVKIDVNTLGNSLPKSPGKIQTLLKFSDPISLSSGTRKPSSSLSSPILIDLTSSAKKRTKISHSSHTTVTKKSPRRQLDLTSFFCKNQGVEKDKNSSVICLDL